MKTSNETFEKHWKELKATKNPVYSPYEDDFMEKMCLYFYNVGWITHQELSKDEV